LKFNSNISIKFKLDVKIPRNLAISREIFSQASMQPTDFLNFAFEIGDASEDPTL
jgi:hypothetical protein